MHGAEMQTLYEELKKENCNPSKRFPVGECKRSTGHKKTRDGEILNRVIKK